MSKNSHKVPTIRISQTQPRGRTEQLSNPEIDFVIRHVNKPVSEVEYVKTLNDLCSERVESFVKTKVFEPFKYVFMPFTFAKKEKMIAKIAEFPDGTTPEDVVNKVLKIGELNETELLCMKECIRPFNGKLYWVEIHPDERSRGVRL